MDVDFLQLVLRGYDVDASLGRCMRVWRDLLATDDRREARNIIIDEFALGPHKAEGVLDQLGQRLRHL